MQGALALLRLSVTVHSVLRRPAGLPLETLLGKKLLINLHRKIYPLQYLQLIPALCLCAVTSKTQRNYTLLMPNYSPSPLPLHHLVQPFPAAPINSNTAFQSIWYSIFLSPLYSAHSCDKFCGLVD